MKKIIIGLLIFIILILGTLTIMNNSKLTVLTYHDFTDGEVSDVMQKNIDDFEKEMKYLHDHNYKSLTLNDVECFYDKKCKLKRKSVLITMDDGWKSELKYALPILKKYNLNAVIFYIGSNYDGHNEKFLNKDDLEKIKKDYPNIEIASHTYDNHYEDAYLKSTNELNVDFNKMKDIIDTKYFAYPYGHYSDNYIKSLKNNNYKLAFTFGPDKEHRKASIKDNRYKVPRLNLSTTYPFWKYKLKLILPF